MSYLVMDGGIRLVGLWKPSFLVFKLNFTRLPGLSNTEPGVIWEKIMADARVLEVPKCPRNPAFSQNNELTHCESTNSENNCR